MYVKKDFGPFINQNKLLETFNVDDDSKTVPIPFSLTNPITLSEGIKFVLHSYFPLTSHRSWSCLFRILCTTFGSYLFTIKEITNFIQKKK